MDIDVDEDILYLNGVSGRTGGYLVPPVTYKDLAALIKGQPLDKPLAALLKSLYQAKTEPHLGLPAGIDPADVRQAGWGIVFHIDEAQDVRAALDPLIQHRQQQIGNETIVKQLQYHDGDDYAKWLQRHQVSAGSINPTKVPFYLLLVGSPERIPFLFSQVLSVEYAIGRLHFNTAGEYSAYVRSLIAYETSSSVPNAKEAVFFATRHDFDRATQISADYLVNPLADGYQLQAEVAARAGVATRQGFRTRKMWGAEATKKALAEILRPPAGARSPAFLFTASHGVGDFPPGDQIQLENQGALLCQDWSAPDMIEPKHYFAANDVPADANVHGMLQFHFACYAAGTPAYDRYLRQAGQAPPRIAAAPFIAALPKALLAHPNGGILACIGHIDRAWEYSILSRRVGPQIQPFENAIDGILSGKPIGYALKDFRERYAALSTSLASKQDPLAWPPPTDQDLTRDWIERNDAEGYLCLGDPAAQLRVSKLE